jgi:SAM-dependent MidA family methyltransferase
LLELLRERISHRGPLPFAEFMEVALYHPGHGFYARPEDPVGTEEGSDYYTAPSRHPAFGLLLGRQVAECLGHVGEGEIEVVEFGPGSGALFVSLLRELGKLREDRGDGVRGTLVEANPAFVRKQRRHLSEAGMEKRVRWLTPAQWKERREPIRGCVIANELLDALPVHRLICREGRIREIFVDWRDRLVEVTGEVSRPEILEELERQRLTPREEQEVEVSLESLRWIRELGARMERGYSLLLDYGHTAPAIHSGRHQRGTLLAYHRHRTSEEYLERVGHQDLTAHVNFTSVLDAARASGLQAVGPVSQGRFLLALGALDCLGRPGDGFDWREFNERKALQDLFVPHGMGESHQVLVLATPGMDMDLTGLKPPERWTVPATGEPAEAGPHQGE